MNDIMGKDIKRFRYKIKKYFFFFNFNILEDNITNVIYFLKTNKVIKV